MQKARWMMRYVSKYKMLWLGGYFFQVLFLGFYQICNAYALENIGNGMVELNKDFLIKGLVIFASGAVLAMLSENLYWRLTGKALAFIRRDIKADVFGRLLEQEGSGAEEDSAGRMEYINQDVELAMGLIGDAFKQLALGAGTSIIAIAAIISKNVAIGLFCIFGFLVSVLINVYYIMRQKKVVLEGIASTNRVNMIYSDMLYGAKTIRNMKLQRFMKEKIEQGAQKLWRVKQKQRRISLLQNMLSRLFLCLNNLAPMAMGIYFCAKGQMPVGTVFFLVQIILQFNNDYEMIGPAIVDLSRDIAGAERISGILEGKGGEPKVCKNQSGMQETGEKKGHEIELKDFTVAYGNGKGIAIDRMKLQENSAVALIGKSGSGKSTLLKAMLQLLPYEGELRYGGNCMESGDLSFLRSQIAYAGPESKLFEGKTILENIRYGKERCSLEEVRDLFGKIGGEDFILNLAKGYDTVIGEDGVQLSGGEEQRILLVRALVKQAPVLLLDEVTSAVNAGIRDQVYRYIQQEKKNRMILFSTHDIEFARQADWVIVMKEGKPVSQGSPRAVLQAANYTNQE